VLGLRDVLIAAFDLWEREHFQQLRLLVPLEFEAADIAAINGLGARPIFGVVMRDGGPAGGTMPWHGEKELIVEVNRLCQEPETGETLLGGLLDRRSKPETMRGHATRKQER